MKFTPSLALGIVCAFTGLAALQTASAGAHGGQKASNVEELPVRSGDWSEEEISRGREQLIRAFDAAWIRIIASGKDQAIIAHPV